MYKQEIENLIHKCKYYQSRSEYRSFNSLNELPIIDRNVVRDNNDQFIINKCLQNAVVKETSGTTGAIVKVVWDASDYYASIKPIWMIRRKFGITPSDVYITDHAWITNASINPGIKIYIDNNRISLSKIYIDDGTLMSYVNIISQSSPSWMMISPSFAIVLGMYLKKCNLVLNSIKLVELSGEYVSNECHEYIEKLFYWTIVKSQYGMTECNVIGYEHDYEKNVLVTVPGNIMEIVNCKGEPCLIGETGDVLVTNYSNRNMPILRYRTGDVATLLEKSNECLKFKIESSRESDYYTYKGIKYNSSIFYCIVQQYNNHFSDYSIDQFLFIGREKESLLAKLHLKTGFELNCELRIKERLEKIFDSIIGSYPEITVEIVNTIPKMSKKKSYFVVDNVTAQE